MHGKISPYAGIVKVYLRILVLVRPVTSIVSISYDIF